MGQVQYRIAGLSLYRDEYSCLMEPLLTGAQALGHQTYGLVIRQKVPQVLEFIRTRRVEFCLVTGRSVGHLLVKHPSFFPAFRAASVPLVVLWYDNPLRYLNYLFHVYGENVLLVSSIDTKCVEELKALGFDRTVYVPIWSLTDNFHPPARRHARYELSFAGGYMNRPYLETEYLPRHAIPLHRLLFDEQGSRSERAWALLDDFLALRQEVRRYVDAYAFLRSKTEMDPFSPLFSHWSDLLMHHQKRIEREQLVETVLQVPDAFLHCFGGADVILRKTDTMASAWDRVSFHPALDKRTALQDLYTSTAINLGLSQFPRAVHNRYFECAACGGFMIGEHKADLDDLFEVGKEIVCFEDLDELPDLIRFYRSHETERRRIGERARARHLNQHTPVHRMRRLLPLVERELERFRDCAKVNA